MIERVGDIMTVVLVASNGNFKLDDGFWWHPQMFHKLYPDKLSDCHREPVYVSSGDDGTNCYMCSKCDRICDDIPKKTETKKQKRLKNETGKSLDSLKKEFYKKFTESDSDDDGIWSIMTDECSADQVWEWIEKALLEVDTKHNLLDKLGWKVGDILIRYSDYYEVRGEELCVILSFPGDTPVASKSRSTSDSWREGDFGGFKLYKPKTYKLKGEYTEEELKEILEE